MDLLNFSEWLLKHFNLRIPGCYKNIYFQFDCSVPPHIYVFDTSQSWDYFYTNIVNNLDQNGEKSKHNITVTLHQLVTKNGFWEKLYYFLGKNFFLFFFLECRIYFKWGSNTYILLPLCSKFTNPEKPYNLINEYVPSSVFVVGFEKDLFVKIHKILYSATSQKGLKYLLPKKSPTLLKIDILNQYVGPEISNTNAFGMKQMKSLKRLIERIPTIRDCKLILDNIVHIQDNMVPVQKVILFLTKTMEIIVPYKLLFDRNIFRKFLRNMQKFLKFTLKQKITLGFVMNGIAENQDPLKRNTIAKIIMWLINKVLVKIIRSFFYVCAAKGHSLIFYKQQFWVDFQKMAVSKMISESRLLPVHGSICSKKLKKIKFFPKLHGSGYRPLVTSSKFDESEKDKLELCNILLKQLIASKRKNVPNPSNELHSAWLNYVKTKNKTLQYYYVKTDIKDAYGSILHDRLKSILLDWCDGVENNLTLMTFEFKRKWGKLETVQQFVNLPSSVGKKILIYKIGRDKVVSLHELRKYIVSYIDNIYVTISSKKYKVIRGLPQGGKLSAALCEIYYTSFDQEYLSNFCNFGKGEILLRAVDDYIFISDNEKKIQEFLDIMSTGIPRYGVEIQNEKTATNLCEFSGTTIYGDSIVPFFGYNLGMNSGFITPALDNYKDINIQSTITFNKLDKRILLQKMSSALTLKLHPLLFNHGYQSIRTMLFNIHCASCVMALRYVAMVYFLKLANTILEDKYLIFCIDKGTHSISSHVCKKGSKLIEYAAAKKMCLKSFILILKRKQFNSEMLRTLELKASRLNVKSRISKIIKAVGKVLPSRLSYSLLS